MPLNVNPLPLKLQNIKAIKCRK